MTTETYAPMDVSSILDSEEMIAEYLTAAAEDGDTDALLLALANVAKARGMAQVASVAGLGREGLYKALAPGSHPTFKTIAAVMRARGFRLKMGNADEPARSKVKAPPKAKIVAVLQERKARLAARKAAAKSTAKRRA
jgi:probable addiction module antidote protein